MKKLTALASSELVPGIDYVVKDEGGDNWVPLENVAATASLRDVWILRRRRRPRAPHFKGCPLPKHKPGSAEQNAKITMTYFHPWTLREAAWSDEHVPTLQELKQGWEVLGAAGRVAGGWGGPSKGHRCRRRGAREREEGEGKEGGIYIVI